MSDKRKKNTVLHGDFSAAALDALKKEGNKEVFVLEGRPDLKAAQKTCRELLKRKIKPVLISDNMAGFLFDKKMVREVWASYQIADDMGAVCRIGALILAVLGKKHKVPVYLYRSNERSKFMGKPEDLFYFQGKRIAPRGINGYVPLVEWVPQKYINRCHE